MKKLLIVMMTVLLISALFISCSNEVEKDTLGKVSISFDEAKDISSSMASSIKPVSALKWYYTAVKTSGLYASGQKTELTKIEAGLVEGTSLGDFSTGNWEFSFYGFNADADKNTITKAIYSATEIPVTVSGSGTNKVNIVLSLNEQAVDNGQVKFENLSFDLTGWEDDILTGEKLTLKIYQGEVAAGNLKATFESATVGDKTSYPLTLSDGEASLSLDAGTYSFNFVVLYDGEEVASDSRSVNLSKGAVVTFYGDVHKTSSKNSVILGSISGEVDGLATSEVIQPSAVAHAFTVNADISPASISYVDAPAESAKTVVDFAEGSVEAADDATYKLVTNVTGVEKAATATGFVMSSEEDNTAFAAIDLTLFEVKNEEETEKSLSTNGSVTVTTYIAKGLSKVYVTYNGTNESNPLVTSDENDTGAAFTTGGKAHVYETAEGMGDNLGYAQDTGLLRFRTTHFSEFVVDAEQNVYDKTNNTAYKLTELTEENTDKTHEYVLLDSTKSNEVPDAIDNFNAGYKWSAVHPAGENPNTEEFAGGYGTKIEPYLIDGYDTMQNITTISEIKLNVKNYLHWLQWYGSYHEPYAGYNSYDEFFETEWLPFAPYAEDPNNSIASYFMVKDRNMVINCNQNVRTWKSVKLYGSFNGNGCEFVSLNSPLFSSIDSDGTAIVCNFTADCNIITQTGRAAICGYGADNMTLRDISVTGYIEGQGQTAGVVSYPGSGVTTFERVNVSADILALGDNGAAVFVINPYQLLADYGGDENSKLVFDDCHFTGHLAATGSCFFIYAHSCKVPVELINISESEYGSLVPSFADNRYALASQSSKITKGVIDISAVEPGRTFEINKLNENAVKCTVTVAISPNGPDETGSFTGVYLRDKDLTLNDGVFTTNTVVKLTSAYVNYSGKLPGLLDLDGDGFYESYNIVSTGYGTTHNGGHLSVIQYDSNGNVVGFAQATLFGATQNN